MQCSPLGCCNARCLSDKGHLLCTGCRVATYCSKACQKQAWKQHRTPCKQRAQQQTDERKAAEFYDQGFEYQQAKDLGRSAACYRLAIQLDAGHPGAPANLGCVLQRLGDISGAITAYRQAISLQSSPRSETDTVVDAMSNLSVALAQTDDFKGAIEMAEGALRLAPNDPEATHNILDFRTRLHQQSKDNVRARLSTLERLESEFADAPNAPVVSDLVRLLTQLDQFGLRCGFERSPLAESGQEFLEATTILSRWLTDPEAEAAVLELHQEPGSVFSELFTSWQESTIDFCSIGGNSDPIQYYSTLLVSVLLRMAQDVHAHPYFKTILPTNDTTHLWFLDMAYRLHCHQTHSHPIPHDYSSGGELYLLITKESKEAVEVNKGKQGSSSHDAKPKIPDLTAVKPTDATTPNVSSEAQEGEGAAAVPLVKHVTKYGADRFEKSDQCGYCSAGANHKCAECRMVFYCCKEHQVLAWVDHRAACTALKHRRHMIEQDATLAFQMPEKKTFQFEPADFAVRMHATTAEYAIARSLKVEEKDQFDWSTRTEGGVCHKALSFTPKSLKKYQETRWKQLKTDRRFNNAVECVERATSCGILAGAAAPTGMAPRVVGGALIMSSEGGPTMLQYGQAAQNTDEHAACACCAPENEEPGPGMPAIVVNPELRCSAQFDKACARFKAQKA
jgi:tetratricopeptide (TPR) repeat protein